ncbi:MAG: hypothetical protein CL785_03485 [Chloroflexi bacterium]|mgnify:CR=1 FL=1|nr:hypothetical protein [Chloroflexota bacterium]|tara:strand:- start:21871 stop:22734 length:864 start_codon:yes stop_codon:yes gene_type:complete
MSRVDTTYNDNNKSFVSIVDVSPPRDTNLKTLDNFQNLNPDFLSIAYNPGKIPRVDSLVYAHMLKERYGIDVIFSTATRDMNKLALGTRMMSASMLGLENAIVLYGDHFSQKELDFVLPVHNQKPSELIYDSNQLNYGLDNRGSKLPSLSSICIGATIDLNNDIDRELLLMRKKIQAGAGFFISQPTFDFITFEKFFSRYQMEFDNDLQVPVFWGIQILVKNGLRLGEIPKNLEKAIESDEDMLPYAINQVQSYLDFGVRGLYVVPPIYRGGRRDYDSAARLLDTIN